MSPIIEKNVMKKNLEGTLILLIAAFIWGTAFVAQTTASEVVGAFSFNAYRSFVGSAFLFLLSVIFAATGKKETDTTFKKRLFGNWPVVGGIICGVILTAAMNFQQLGIQAYPEGAAASGRSGFLTAMYVIFVAIASRFMGRKLHPLVIASAVVAAIGMYFLCLSSGITNIYMGDILCFCCAICFTIHILVVDKYSYVDSVKLSCLQFLVAGILSLIIALCVEGTQYFTGDVASQAAFSIFYLGVMSSGVAYTLQMVGQKYAEPAVASIAMSMESVFAALAGWMILKESLSGRELFGCVLMFSAVIAVQIPGFLKSDNG